MDKSKIPIHQPYNPLDKRNIGQSIVKAMLEAGREPLPPKPFIAAGVYAIYYKGGNKLYGGLADDTPIYVGKAVPAGARKGNIGFSENQGKALFNRLSEHAESIIAAQNLAIGDFTCRYIAVDDIWIPLAETILIDLFKPVWNVVVDGFGNHDPGKGRHRQQRSAWDTIHPGRAWAARLEPNRRTKEEIEQCITEYFKEQYT